MTDELSKYLQNVFGPVLEASLEEPPANPLDFKALAKRRAKLLAAERDANFRILVEVHGMAPEEAKAHMIADCGYSEEDFK